MGYGFTVVNDANIEVYSSEFSTFKVIKTVNVTAGMSSNIAIPSSIGKQCILIGVPIDEVANGSYVSSGVLYVSVSSSLGYVTQKMKPGSSMQIIVGVCDE